MQVRFAAAVVAIAFVAVGTVDAASPWENDAGSGLDAANAESSALALGADGRYAGNLLARGDTDWYVRGGFSGLTCSQITVSSASGASAGLVGIRGDGSRKVMTSAIAPGASVTLSAFGRDVREWRGVVENAQSADVQRPYEIAWRTFTLADVSGDAGTGADAPESGLTVPAGCIGGTVGGTDVRDAYTFAGGAGQRIAFSVAQTGGETVSLSLVSPSGQTLATVAPGELVDLALPEQGTYTMTASSFSTASVLYFISLVDGPEPPGSGCKPTC